MGSGVTLSSQCELERIADRRHDLMRSANRSERNKRDTVTEGSALTRGNFQCQARFTDPARPDQGE